MTTLLELIRTAGTDDADRDRVLDAAREAFLDFGIRRSSIGEIARRAGSSPATLHRRFGQKGEIVVALLMREAREFIERASAQVVVEDPAAEQVTDLAYAVLTGLRGHELLQRLITTEPEDMLPLLTTQAGPVLALGTDYLEEFLHRLQGDGRLPDFDAAPVAEILARLVLSLALTPGTSVPLDEESFRAFSARHIVPILGV